MQAPRRGDAEDACAEQIHRYPATHGANWRLRKVANAVRSRKTAVRCAQTPPTSLHFGCPETLRVGTARFCVRHSPYYDAGREMKNSSTPNRLTSMLMLMVARDKPASRLGRHAAKEVTGASCSGLRLYLKLLSASAKGTNIVKQNSTLKLVGDHYSTFLFMLCNLCKYCMIL